MNSMKGNDLMKEILFINTCISIGKHRTEQLSRALIDQLITKTKYQITELNLEHENIAPLNSELLKKREYLMTSGKLHNPMFDYARQFCTANIIVIGTPYWDLSFPAILKCYFENIAVQGITFDYSADGKQIGLCKAEKIYYVTTVGGYIGDNNFGFDYIRGLGHFFGIKSVECIAAEGMDIDGNNEEMILQEAISKIGRICS